jgi:hypothetical protein
MNCPCVKRKFFLKDMNCERYVRELMILWSKCTIVPMELVDYMQRSQRKFVHQAAEEWKERNYDNMVRAIYG